MNSVERRSEILKNLKKNEIVEVSYLAKKLGVSNVTIRSDLDFLVAKGMIVRTYGGAVIADKPGILRFVSNLLNEYTTEKERIARAASEMIHGGMQIIIDTGSTTVRLMDYIKDMAITIVTNSLLVAAKVEPSSSIELILAGGTLSKYCMGFLGEITKYDIQRINADILFLGTAGYSVNDNILTCESLEEAEIKRTMIMHADKICLMADSSKAEKKAFAKVCPLDKINSIITDQMTENTKTWFHKNHIATIIV